MRLLYNETARFCAVWRIQKCPSGKEDFLMSKMKLPLLTALLVLMVVSLTVLVPSGAVTDEALSRYEDALWEQEEDEEESAREVLKPRAVLANAALSDVLPAANIKALDSGLFTPGSAPLEANFTEDSYRDDSIIVEMEKKRLYDSDVFIAYVRIATPSQIRTAVAGSKLKSSNTNLITRITANYNGIVAVNGDFYSNSEKKGGYMVRQKEIFREKVSNNYDLLVIDEMGDFHILPRGKENQQNGISTLQNEHEIVNCFFFGPALVVDGEVQGADTYDQYAFDPTQPNPRAAIGQIGPLTYAVVVVNGRTSDTVGVTMEQLATIMGDIGCQQADNLDGGNSATLVFHNEIYSAKENKERSVSDIIYFASAIGE